MNHGNTRALGVGRGGLSGPETGATVGSRGRGLSGFAKADNREEQKHHRGSRKKKITGGSMVSGEAIGKEWKGNR